MVVVAVGGGTWIVWQAQPRHFARITAGGIFLGASVTHWIRPAQPRRLNAWPAHPRKNAFNPQLPRCPLCTPPCLPPRLSASPAPTTLMSAGSSHSPAPPVFCDTHLACSRLQLPQGTAASSLDFVTRASATRCTPLDVVVHTRMRGVPRVTTVGGMLTASSCRKSARPFETVHSAFPLL